MTPIFNEYIQFLNDVNNSDINLSDLQEGYFWLDNSIIKGFDKQGNIHKFFRIKIDDYMNVNVIVPKSGYDNIKNIDIASWRDIIELQKQHLEEIENKSLCLIKEKHDKFSGYTSIIPISTGKDSMCVAHLVRSLYPDTKAVFNNTSLDVVETYCMAKQIPNCQIMNPSKGFYQYVQQDHMVPSRFARFCCRIFKVGVMVSNLDHNHPYLMWMGMRNDESNTRSDYQDEWVNTAEWGDTCWQGILPIRKWTEMDVWLYTLWKGIAVNKKYKYGYSRVGCAVACPYYTKSTWVLDKYWYPKAYERWRNILKQDFIDNKKWLIMNCTIDEYINIAWNGGTYRDEPTEDTVKEFMRYNNIEDYGLANRYFNKKCCKCGKRIKNKDVIAMNMKVHGRDINKFYCKKCFKDLHNMSENDWNERVETFKQSGCNLF